MNANNISRCAACGNEGDSLKSCTACRLVKYCNVTCQKAHRKNHKKECKRRVAELLDEALFKEPPKIDCPICFLPLPHESEETAYQLCCGKVLCNGCVYGVTARAAAEQDENLNVCPFCREQKEKPASDQEYIEGFKARMECGDGVAFNQMGGAYGTGSKGMPLDPNKACEMWIRSGELGCASGYFNAGSAYHFGQGVVKDMKKAKHYYGLAAMGGDADARHNLGCSESQAGNKRRSNEHFMIAAKAGHKPSLDKIKQAYLVGDVTKDKYEKTLRAYQKSKDEVKSDMRDKVIRNRERARAMGLDSWTHMPEYQ